MPADQGRTTSDTASSIGLCGEVPLLLGGVRGGVSGGGWVGRPTPRFKMMTLLDEYTRQCLAMQVERQITAAQVLAVLEKAMIQYGAPDDIRSDNGPEGIAAKVQQGLKDHHIKTIYIEPGARGKTDISKGSTADSAMNVSAERC